MVLNIIATAAVTASLILGGPATEQADTPDPDMNIV